MIRERTYSTLKDVAKKAGCSPAVASTVINGARGNTVVGKAMRERVKRAAAELGYRRNFASSSLIQQRTRTLGIYIPPGSWSGLGYSYEDTILRGIELSCRQHGYDLLLMNIAGSQPPQICLDKLAERRIDGLILMRVADGQRWLQDLAQRSYHVVAVDYSSEKPEVDAIVFDNKRAGELAVDHLVALGHRRIGFVGSCCKPVSRDAVIRQEGFLSAMSSRHLEVRPEWIFNERLMPKPVAPEEAVCQIEGREAARHALSLGDGGPTAWLAYCDLVAVSMLQELKENGVVVPRDVSLMGVDDAEWCRVVDPALSTISHPLEEMGRLAVSRLISSVEMEDEFHRVVGGARIVVDPALVARKSTGAPCGEGVLPGWCGNKTKE